MAQGDQLAGMAQSAEPAPYGSTTAMATGRSPDSVSGATSGAPALLQLAGLIKRFGVFTAVDNVSLDIAAGEFFALLGPSGCGKTTLLRMIAGFENVDGGKIVLGSEDITARAPHERPLNMMFQNYALFPHLSVRDNVAFGLRRAGMARSEIDARVEEMLALVTMSEFATRKPDRLSGGQRQRVALARALALHPRALLLDEPLAALDKALRERTQRELKQLQRRLGMTFIVVTHDQEEAMSMADRIAVMRAGRLEQVATPRVLYERPVSRWVAEFIGDVNVLEGRLTRREGNRIEGETEGFGPIVARGGEPRFREGQPVTFAIRPERIRLARSDDSSDNSVAARVVDITYLGDLTFVRAKVSDDVTIKVAVANAGGDDTRDLRPGDTVRLAFDADAVLTLDPAP